MALTRSDFGLVALVLGFIGAGLMLTASVLLILESRIGLTSTFVEMDFLWKRHNPAEKSRAKSFWRYLASGR